MRTRLMVNDDMVVETGATETGVGWLRITQRDHGVRLDSLDPIVWERIAHAAQALSHVHMAAVAPPPHRDMTS